MAFVWSLSSSTSSMVGANGLLLPLIIRGVLCSHISSHQCVILNAKAEGSLLAICGQLVLCVQYVVLVFVLTQGYFIHIFLFFSLKGFKRCSLDPQDFQNCPVFLYKVKKAPLIGKVSLFLQVKKAPLIGSMSLSLQDGQKYQSEG